ncbi:MAG: hypothetical protein WC794_03315 [Candidatus Doudnabacteria bacterium]|jgi:hypothetical protein
MSEITGKSEYKLGQDLSGRPEGVSEVEWKKILESARNQVIAERSGTKNETTPGQVLENNPGEPVLVSVPAELGSSSKEFKASQTVENQGSVEELRKNILERALNILNGSHSSEDGLNVNNPDGVASFVDKLNKMNSVN